VQGYDVLEKCRYKAIHLVIFSSYILVLDGLKVKYIETNLNLANIQKCIILFSKQPVKQFFILKYHKKFNLITDNIALCHNHKILLALYINKIYFFQL
jgi:hypothetical protein